MVSHMLGTEEIDRELQELVLKETEGVSPRWMGRTRNAPHYPERKLIQKLVFIIPSV